MDVSLPHLDRPFEYLVPESLDAAATVGCRVRVRFSGRLTSGYLLRRTAESEHQGRLGYLERVVSPEPVLTEEIAGLARAVADRYGGTLADVLRLAIPPRHAAAESAGRRAVQAASRPEPPPSEASSPRTAQPDAAQPQAAQPQAAQPDATELEAIQPEAQEAAAAQPGATRPDESPAEADQPEAARSTAVQPEAAQRGTAHREAAQREKAQREKAQREPPEPGSWARYVAGPSFLTALAAGRAPRAVWSALPGAGPATPSPATPSPPTGGEAASREAASPAARSATGDAAAASPSPEGRAALDSAGAAPPLEGGWAAEIALAAAATAASGRGVVIVVPDARDLEQADAALAATLGPGAHVVLSASLGPAERYRRWLAAARGQVAVVAGTRSAMFAPVRDLGLVVLWDEGDDLHAEPRAPYPHAREVLALRAHRAGAAALLGGFARTAEAENLVTAGWARALEAGRATVRRFAPLVAAAGEDSELARDEAARSARLPSLALRTARDALASGPVLFQVPRRGYLAAIACERCHARIRCQCGGPAQLPGPQAAPRCAWCNRIISRTCQECGHSGLRAVVTGATRTAEELGRAFPSVPVHTSGGSRVLTQVSRAPAVVVATPGAEPLADGGYVAAVLLDGWALLGRASLRAGEEAVRRWMNAAALVRPGPAGGRVVVVADAGLAAVQALVRWDPVTFAGRELAERRELRFPPIARMAALSGPHSAVRAVLDGAGLPAGSEVLGPVPVQAPPGGPPGSDDSGGPDTTADHVRFLVRAPRPAGTTLAAELRKGLAARTARKEPGVVRLELDPVELI
ncbi:MAG TPA: primosomal protein N' [Streptosporangiaceae bacterium]